MSESIFGQALDFVKAAIEDLSILLDDSSIIIQEVARYQKDIAKPFISVSPYGAERLLSGTNIRENVSYPVLVAFIADPDQSALDARLLIREKIRRRFHNASPQNISGTNVGAVKTSVEPANAIEPGAFLGQDLFVSGMVVMVEMREPRS